jgi:hypothetical protein
MVFAAWTLWIYLSYGRAQQKLTIQQLALAVKQSETIVASDARRTQLALENARLENQTRRMTIDEASEGRVRIGYELDVYLIDSKRQFYQGDFQIRIENVSKAQVEVSWVVFEWYIGTLPDVLANGAVEQVNAPPKRERGIEEIGPVRWLPAGRKGFRLKDSTLIDRNYFIGRRYFQEGGGPTKILLAGSDAEYTMPLLLRAKADQWLGITAIVGIDGGKTRETRLWVSKWFPLRSAEETSSAGE